VKWFLVKRRTLKKQIPLLAQRLVNPLAKYLTANSRVHPDLIFSYERQLEIAVFRLMQVYLTLDPAWPHRDRWLDRVSEEFRWERNSAVIHGTGEFFWGHLPEVGREITGMPFQLAMQLCPRHSVDYIFRYGDGESVRSYSSQRWCRQDS
jgi:hypothetical protein